jgi:hypothetical protein
MAMTIFMGSIPAFPVPRNADRHPGIGRQKTCLADAAGIT